MTILLGHSSSSIELVYRYFECLSTMGACESTVVTLCWSEAESHSSCSQLQRHTEAAYVSVPCLSRLALGMPWIWYCTFCSPYTCLENRGKVVARALPTHFIYCFISHSLCVYTPVQQFGCSLCWQPVDSLRLNKEGNCCQVPCKFSAGHGKAMLTGDMLTLPNAISFCKGALKHSVSEILVTHSLWLLNPGTAHKESSHIFSVLTGDWVDYNCSQSCFSPWAPLNFYWKPLEFVIDFNAIRIRFLSESLLHVWFPCDISGSFQLSCCLWNGKLTNCYLWKLVGFRLVPSDHK